MWTLILVIGSCFFTLSIFSILAAGRRADEGEEKILELILPPLEHAETGTTTEQKQYAHQPVSKVSAGKD
jgi:hypothetical protein